MYNYSGNLIKANVSKLMSRGREARRLLRIARPSHMNIEKAIEIYLDWKTTHANIAAQSYAPRLLHFARFVGEERELISITGDDVICYHKSLERGGYMKGSVYKKYSKATISYSSRIFKNFFMFWHGRRESNVNHKEILPIRFVTPIKRTVSEEEFLKMNDSLKPQFFNDLRKKLVINLLWDTGMRVSELCQLNISDISDRHSVYGIRSAIVRTRKLMRYNLVAWSKETDDLLTKYLGLRLCIDTASDRLFVRSMTDNTNGITVRTLQRWIDDLSQRAELGEGISPHSFRHGKAHAVLNSPGGDIRDVAAILRHSRPESSYHYTTLNTEKYLQVAGKYLIRDKEKIKAA